MTNNLIAIFLLYNVMNVQSTSEIFYAYFWLPFIFLPILVAGGIVAGGISAVRYFNDCDKINLAILGPNAAGKTTLWNFFQGLNSAETYTETDGTIKLNFKSSGKEWNIKDNKFSGYDFNGNGDFMKSQWPSLIKESNMIFFVFDASKYLNDTEYERDINQRLQFIKKEIDSYNDDKRRGVWLLGSYADKLKNRKEDWRKILDTIKKKPYNELSQNNSCLNLLSKNEFEVFYKRIFSK